MAKWKLILLVLVLFSLKSYAAKTPPAYDYYNAEDRYRWYQDVRKYIGKHNGLNCVPPTKLVISKDGAFSVIDVPSYYGSDKITTSPELCLKTVQNKKYPLPANSPLESFTIPIRSGDEGPLTSKELDALIYHPVK